MALVQVRLELEISSYRHLYSGILDEPPPVSSREFYDSYEDPPPWNVTFAGEEESPDRNSTDELVPERLTADYVEMGILAAMVLIGGPLNFVSLFRSLRVRIPGTLLSSFRLRGKYGSRVSIETCAPKRVFSLKVHLTVANLLVLWGYALSDLCWLATHSWLGGDFMCRAIRCLHAFCFYATSNIISTIAIQRLKVAMRLDRPASRRRSTLAMKPVLKSRLGRMGTNVGKLAYGAWILAFLCSVPQLFIWKTYEAYPGGWKQCVTTWTIQRFEAQKESLNISTQMEYQEKIYNFLHLVFVFWLPVLVIVSCYVLVLTRFSKKIRKQTMQIAAEVTAQVENRAASVRASLVLGGPVDAGSPLLLPIAVFRAMQYQSMGCARPSLPNVVSTPIPVHSALILRQPNQNRLFCLPCWNRPRYGPTGSVGALRTDEEREYGENLATAPSILNATLIGGGKPHARKSFALATLSKAKKRTMKTTLWILLAYLLCWSPYNVLVLWRYISPNENLYDFEIMYNLIVLNAVVNPLLYGI